MRIKKIVYDDGSKIMFLTCDEKNLKYVPIPPSYSIRLNSKETVLIPVSRIIRILTTEVDENQNVEEKRKE